MGRLLKMTKKFLVVKDFKAIANTIKNGLKQNLKPFIVRLIEDKDYSFITQKKNNSH